MSIFVTSKADRPTTTSDRSSKTINQKGRDKTVTPFVCEEKSVSPARRRVDHSPLQGALTIAIRKITAQNGKVWPRPSQFPQDLLGNQLSRTGPLNLSSQDNALNDPKIENLKNVLQQFIESLYCQVESQIYSKFNAEMKRMVIKYRQTESMLKSLQQKITYNADVLQLQRQLKQKEELHRKQIMEMLKKMEGIVGQMEYQSKEKENIRKENQLLRLENQKLSNNVERYQNILLRQIQQTQYRTERSLHDHKHYQNSRQTTSFTNLIAGKNKLSNKHLSDNHESLDYSRIMMTNSQTLNVNRLQPSLSPVSSKREQRSRRTLQAKRKPVCFCEVAEEEKGR